MENETMIFDKEFISIDPKTYHAGNYWRTIVLYQDLGIVDLFEPVESRLDHALPLPTRADLALPAIRTGDRPHDLHAGCESGLDQPFGDSLGFFIVLGGCQYGD